MRTSAHQLHNSFKAAHGATCCSVLTRKVKHNKKAHFQRCADLTAEAAELAARLVLAKRPDLIAIANNAFIARRESKVRGALNWLMRFFI